MKKCISIILLSVLMMLVVGCQKAKVSSQSPIDPSLPTVHSIKALSAVNEIALEWKPFYDESIMGYLIYRAESVSPEKYTQIANIKNRYSSHYLDQGLTSSKTYIYYMRTYSNLNKISNFSEPLHASTKEPIASVPFSKAISSLPNTVKIIWRPHPDSSVQSYLVERSDFGSLKWKQIAEVKGRLNAEYLDEGLKENSLYKYRIFAKSIDGSVSKPSEVMDAKTKPLPPMVENLNVTKDLPKKIVISWGRVDQEDISHYNIYTAPSAFMFFTLKGKTKSTTFEDLVSKNGEQIYYKVTSVDEDGLESLKQKNAIIGNTLESPKVPIFTGITQNRQEVLLTWTSEDDRAVKYEIKKEGDGTSVVLKEIQNTSFSDKNVKPGVKYSYSIVAIDKFGLVSKRSKKVSVVTSTELF